MEKLCNIVNHPLRQQILIYIDTHEQATVTELYTYFRIEQSAMSLHLKLLRGVQLLHNTPKGKNRYYTINYIVWDKLNQAINQYFIYPASKNVQ
ncbi:MAG: hypothetical protein QM528_05970 [Phycisphaerales bacterium]|nr:hypothetical protein [Phycisphaerales bacterium]